MGESTYKPSARILFAHRPLCIESLTPPQILGLRKRFTAPPGSLQAQIYKMTGLDRNLLSVWGRSGDLSPATAGVNDVWLPAIDSAAHARVTLNRVGEGITEEKEKD